MQRLTQIKSLVQPAAEQNTDIETKSCTLHLWRPLLMETFLQVKIRASGEN